MLSTYNMIDLLILNYNDSKTCIDLLETVKNYRIFTRILIVDNCSSDSSYEALREYNDNNVTVIKSDKNGGYGYGNNYGIRYLYNNYKSKYILITNPDVIFTEETIIELFNTIEKHPEYIIMAPLMCDKDGNYCQNSGWKISSLKEYVLGFSIIYSKYFDSNNIFLMNESQDIVTVDAVSGSLLLVRTEAMLNKGMYDERLFLYCEETALGFKIKSSGLKTGIITNLKYIHNHSVSISKTYSSEYQKRRLLLYSKLLIVKEYYKASFFYQKLAWIIGWFSMVELCLILNIKNIIKIIKS